MRPELSSDQLVELRQVSWESRELRRTYDILGKAFVYLFQGSLQHPLSLLPWQPVSLPKPLSFQAEGCLTTEPGDDDLHLCLP